jgi:hypothetical protein
MLGKPRSAVVRWLVELAVDYRILGSLEARDGGDALPLGSAQERSLLALLLLNANELVPTDRLVDELWGDRPPKTAVKTVQVYVSRLRKALHAASPGQQPSGQQAQGSSPLSCSTAVPGTSRSLDPTSLTWTVSSGSLVRARGRYQQRLSGPPLAESGDEPFAQAQADRPRPDPRPCAGTPADSHAVPCHSPSSSGTRIQQPAS